MGFGHVEEVRHFSVGGFFEVEDDEALDVTSVSEQKVSGCSCKEGFGEMRVGEQPAPRLAHTLALGEPFCWDLAEEL